MAKRAWLHGRYIRTGSALLIGALAALLATGGAGAAAAPNTYTGCLQLGLVYNVAIGATPAFACPKGATKISWNEPDQQGATADAALGTRIDGVTADLTNEAQTRDAVDSAFTNTFLDTATALNPEDLDFLQAEAQAQIATIQTEISATDDATLQEMMQQQQKTLAMMSNLMKKMADTANSINQNLKG